jgi:nitrite reductase/ring-hydroxylating ferredoxin subunit
MSDHAAGGTPNVLGEDNLIDWRDLPNAPPPGTALGEVADIPDGSGLERTFGTTREPFRVLLLRRQDRVWAYHNCCPHFSLPLNYEPQTFITLDAEIIMCAHHAAFFRFDDGACVDGPCTGTALRPIPLVRVGSRLQVGGGERVEDAVPAS